MACHDVARSKIFLRLASTLLASVPTSATLIANKGFRAAMAAVSAVKVLPTPGGPEWTQFLVLLTISRESSTVKKHDQSLSLSSDNIIHIKALRITRAMTCH